MFNRLIVCLALTASAALADTAEIVFFRGIMSPFGENPVTNIQAGAPATIICHIVRDSAGKINSASLDFIVGYGFPPSTGLTALDVHSGAAGTTGPVVIQTSVGANGPEPSDPSGFGLINLQSQVLPTNQTGLAALNGMLANPDQYYVDIHTTNFPNGAIRAQLNRATFVVPMSVMSSSKVVPAVSNNSSTAAGQLVVLTAHDRTGAITSTQLIFDVNYNFGKTTTISGVHVHRGAAGVSGPLTIDSGLGQGFFPPIQTDSTGAGNFRQFTEVDMSNPDAAATVQGLIDNPQAYYMDIHTADYPNGAVRDQIHGSDLVRLPITQNAPGQSGSTVPPYAPTLLLLRMLRAEDGTTVMGSIMWICNYRFPGSTVFTGLDIYDGAAGTIGPRRLASGVSLNQPYPSDTGFGNMFFFTTVSDPAGVATLQSITENPEQHYIAILTGNAGTLAVRTQLGAPVSAVPVVNGASNSANGGVVAPGGMISIYGTNLAKVTSDPYDSRPNQVPGLSGWFGSKLPNSYNGTSVTIGGIRAPLVYVSPTQINAQVPMEVPEGQRALVVTNTNGPSAPISVLVATYYAPAVFVGPAGPSIFKAKDGSLVSAANPVSAGDSLFVYATGLGATLPALATGQIATFGTTFLAALPVTATLGTVAVPVQSAVAVPGFTGLYMITLTIPSGVPAGTAKLQINMPPPLLAVFGAPNYSAATPVDLPMK